MPDNSIYLAKIFDGWEGYNTSLLHSVQPLSSAQLTWRPSERLRSVGELASHIAMGRVSWFARMPAPGSLELKRQADALGSEAAISMDKAEIVYWLEASWRLISDTLSQWTVQDLSRSIRQEYGGKVFLVSYQWIIWRILTHDIHHGGELALMLGMQDIEIPELGRLGGHITMPPLSPD